MLSFIAQQYTDIMAHISKQCIDIMGLPPCKFALVGMGSLARKEITPYSDFEHVVVLEELHFKKKKALQPIYEYFRWYSVIFHVIIINLQETIIPSVCIPCLNDSSKPGGNWFFDNITSRGISFDGMMPHACKFPLGRTQTTAKKPFKTELIKTVSDMTKYLNVEEDLKNGYKLADILTRTCFVAGHEKPYFTFLDNIVRIQSQRKEEFLNRTYAQVLEDVKNFDALISLHVFQTSKVWNIKRVIFRATSLFVSALGKIHGLNENSNFDILEALQGNDKIDETTAHRLSFAVAVACYSRLYHYMSKQSQNDIVFENSEAIFAKEIPLPFSNAISKRELIEFFRDIASLQEHLGKLAYHKILTKFSTEKHLWHTLQIKFFLDLSDEVIAEGQQHMRMCTYETLTESDLMVIYFIAHAYMKKFDATSSMQLFGLIANHPSFQKLRIDFRALTYFLLVHCLFSTHNFQKVVNICDDALRSKIFLVYSFNFYFRKGFALSFLGQHHKALSSLRDFLRAAKSRKYAIFRLLSEPVYLQLALSCVADSLLLSGHSDKALNLELEVLEMYDQTRRSTLKKIICNVTIAFCWWQMGCIGQANIFFSRMFEKLSGKPFFPSTMTEIFENYYSKQQPYF